MLRWRNVVFDLETGRVRLIDFGSCARTERICTQWPVCTWLTSPRAEDELGPDGTYDPEKLDVYSAGLVACAFANRGRYPSETVDPEEHALWEEAGGPDLPLPLLASTRLGPAGEAFVRLCCTRDPAQRPSAQWLLDNSPFLQL